LDAVNCEVVEAFLRAARAGDLEVSSPFSIRTPPFALMLRHAPPADAAWRERSRGASTWAKQFIALR
jgi:hypothetical protein